MTTAVINQKITGVSINKDGAKPAESKAPEIELETVSPKMKRPDVLRGETFKIKTPQCDHALYITINDVVLNAGTEHESVRPFEIFLNSKNMDNFQWVVALTRVVSAVFRLGGDVTFLVDELKAIFDPKGGYFKGGKFMPSLVAEIGEAIETHLKNIGLIVPEEMHPAQKAILEEKRREFEAQNDKAPEGSSFPPNATLCGKCHEKAVILMDGCSTCLGCGASKCG